MLYRTMEKTGDELSVLGFGCMRLPQKNGRIDEERATRQIRHAIDCGVNYVDTALPYHGGASEPFLGRALAGGIREKVHLATKLPHWSVRTRADMDALLDAQLGNLQTDHIDYYLIHNLQGPSWERMKVLGLADFLDRAKADGRILHAGFSSHADKETFKTIVDGYDWEFCQIQYNFLDERVQAGTEGLNYAAAKGLGVVVMEPLRGGKLAAKVPSAVQDLWGEAETRRSPAEWALRWVWNHPEVTVVLSGMNEEAHIEENLRVADQAYPGSLTDDELTLVHRVSETYHDLMKIGCTGCQYCMPCPAGVNIAACFDLYNTYHMFDDSHWSTRFDYFIQVGGMLTGTPGYASLCKDCGQCEKACPQHLPIRTLLKDVSREFEGPLMKSMAWVARRGASMQGRMAMRKGQRTRR